MGKVKEWLAWLEERRKDWPVFVSLVIFCFNIELVVTPHILKGLLGLSGHKLRMAAGIWSSIELSWWVFFSIWLFKEKIRKIVSVNTAIEASREFIEEFDWHYFLKPKPEDSYILLRAKSMLYRHIQEFNLATHQEDGAFMQLFGFTKGLGYVLACFFIFTLGLMPLFWVLGLMMCRLIRWRMAYVALFVSNFTKNYFFALIYEIIGFWWLLAAFLLAVSIISFGIKKFMNILRLKAEQKSHH